MSQFAALGLSPRVLQSIEPIGFETPTPIQEKAIPVVLEGHDVIGLAQTGTGKTAAFGLPLVHHLLDNRGKPPAKVVRSLILAPTRELVNQIAENLKLFVRGTPLRVECIVGGAPINRQVRNLKRGADILVATPGRLLDLFERDAVILDQATFLVLDEADQMLDMGFIHALREIAALLGSPRQTLLFSATMARQIENLGRAYLTEPVRIEVSPAGKAADKISQCVHFVEGAQKPSFLKQCLAERPDDLSLVFARTKHGAEKLMKFLNDAGFEAVSIHGNKNQGQRERALKAFRSGRARILVATDVAARGIDIPGVSHVYNYDLPEVAENYVHRIGRTARAGADGEAVAICCPEDIGLLRAVEKLMRMSIDVASGEVPADSRAVNPRRNARGGPRNQGGPRKGGRPTGRAASHRKGARPNAQPRKAAAEEGENRPRKAAPKQNEARKPRQDAAEGKPSKPRRAASSVRKATTDAKRSDQMPRQKSAAQKSAAQKSAAKPGREHAAGKPGGKQANTSGQKRAGGKAAKVAGKKHGAAPERPKQKAAGQPAKRKPANGNAKKRRSPNKRRTAA